MAAQMGHTISEGTLKTDDLLEAFANAIDQFAGDADRDIAMSFAAHSARGRLMAQILRATENDDLQDIASQVLEGMTEVLELLAPEGCAFGAHEGDGALFGFWPVDTADEGDDE